MTVYYVEDDENIRQLVLYALTQSGIQAEGQPDDTAFRAACAKSIPDVVVLDIMLPEVDGLEILRRIRNTPGKLSRVPVMMVTAKTRSWTSCGHWMPGRMSTSRSLSV